MATCLCGCGTEGPPRGGKYRPGHWFRSPEGRALLSRPRPDTAARMKGNRNGHKSRGVTRRPLTAEHRAKLSTAMKGKRRGPCPSRGRAGAASGSWRGGRRKSSGYVQVWLSPEERATHTCPMVHGYIYEHRLKAERAIGRCLHRNEVVHHVNGDRLDNRNTNLVVCTNGYHQDLHRRMSVRWMQEKFGG